MHPEYQNFAALLASHAEGNDFDRVVIRRAPASVVVIAPHGGRIEPRISACIAFGRSGEKAKQTFT